MKNYLKEILGDVHDVLIDTIIKEGHFHVESSCKGYMEPYQAPYMMFKEDQTPFTEFEPRHNIGHINEFVLRLYEGMQDILNEHESGFQAEARFLGLEKAGIIFNWDKKLENERFEKDRMDVWHNFFTLYWNRLGYNL